MEIKEGYEMKVDRLKKGLPKLEKDKKLLTEEMGGLDAILSIPTVLRAKSPGTKIGKAM
jgi:hypothetical protein